MKEYNVKFKIVKENEILIKARNRKEAFEKAMDLLQNTCINGLDIFNVTKHYNLIDINNKSILIIKNRRWFDE